MTAPSPLVFILFVWKSQDIHTHRRARSWVRSENQLQAVAYIRTSSAANVGADKDSDKRQRHAIEAFAKRAGHELVGEFYDAAVSGADHIETRPGFAAMLDRIASNGVRTIIVETASRFARDLMVQEVGFAKLQGPASAHCSRQPARLPR